MGDAPLTPDQMVTSIAAALTRDRPVMIVEHWAAGDWVFRPSGSYYTAELVDVSFAELVRADPGLAGLEDLPGDWVASRRAVGQAWRRRWMYEETRYFWDTEDAEPGAAEVGRSAAEGLRVDVAWNVLHDGEVVAAEGTVPGDLRLSVGIAYLCDHLPTAARHVVVTLAGCERFEYQPYQQPPVSEPSAVAAIGLELLSAVVADGAVSVECADGGYGGQLVMRYTSARASTAEGRPLSQAELESAAGRYWAMWQQRHAEPGAAADGGGI